MKLFPKLLLLALLPVLVTGALLFAVWYYATSSSLREQAENQARAELEAKLSGTLGVFRQVDRSIDAVGKMPALNVGTSESRARALADLGSFMPDRIEAFQFIAADGSIYGSDGVKVSGGGERLLAEVKKNGGLTYVGPPILFAATGRPVVQTVVPLRDKSGEISGAICGLVRVADLFEEILSAKPRNKGLAVLVGPGGQVGSLLLQPDLVAASAALVSSPSITGGGLASDLVKALLSQREGRHEFQLDGERHTLFFSTFPGTDWRIAMAYRDDDIFAVRNRVQMFGLLILLGCFVLALAASQSMWRYIVKPLKEVERAHLAFAGGDMATRASVTTEDEVAALGRSFNQMAERLERSTKAAITELEGRRRAENALVEHENLFRDIIDKTPAVLFIKDLEGRYMMVNARFEALVGAPLSEVCGLTDLDLFPRHLAEAFRDNDRKVIETGNTVECEETMEEKGKKLFFNSLRFPLKNAAGKLYAVGGISTEARDRIRPSLS